MVARHTHASAGAATSIPLSCSICPKAPKFSDVSHLLTHIGSKGHLSTYYKIKVQSAQDDNARNNLDRYDTWYATWDIEHLMSERMTLKDSKRKQKTRKPTTAVVKRHKLNDEPSVQNIPKPYYQNDGLDPRLKDNTAGHDSYAHTRKSSDGASGVYSMPLPYTYMYGPFATGMDMPDIFNEEYEDEDASPYSPTLAKYFRRATDGPEIGARSPAVETVEDESTISELSKLKGILWPGMDMFDSATEDMRRKRNQKKALDVVDRLEAASRDIVATEVIYSDRGIAQKERPITGFPNTSSPLKGESSPVREVPPKAKRRKALQPRSLNVVANDTGKAKVASKPSTKPRTNSTNSKKKAARTPTVASRAPRTRKKSPDRSDQPASPPHSQAFPFQLLLADYPDRAAAEAIDQMRVAQFRSVDFSSYDHIPNYLAQSTMTGHGSSPGTGPASPMMAAWDFDGHEHGSHMINPLFLASDQHHFDDEEEQAVVMTATSAES